jgi:methionine sulfoxide reductase heme-binding subunit
MELQSMRGIQGWRLVGLSALAIGAMVAAIWLVHGIDEQGMRMTIRATARTSCILFLCAFVASALRRVWLNPISTWLLKNRRYLGLSFAVSHTYHAIAWTGLWFVTSGTHPKFDPLGILGYVFLIAMTVTSFERPAALLSQRAWKILHTAGMHYFWLGFTLEFSLRISQSMFIYLPLVILLVFTMLLRVIAPRMQRKLAS